MDAKVEIAYERSPDSSNSVGWGVYTVASIAVCVSFAEMLASVALFVVIYFPYSPFFFLSIAAFGVPFLAPPVVGILSLWMFICAIGCLRKKELARVSLVVCCGVSLSIYFAIGLLLFSLDFVHSRRQNINQGLTTLTLIFLVILAFYYSVMRYMQRDKIRAWFQVCRTGFGAVAS